MKLFLLTITQLFIASLMFGQTYFEVEGKQIKAGSIKTIYEFQCSFEDSFSLYLTDSIIQYENSTNTISKKISYSFYPSTTEPAIHIRYTTVNGQDSLNKYYSGNTIKTIYRRDYDGAGRRVYYGVREFNADSTFEDTYEDFYEYRDSLIETGKIEILTGYTLNTHGEKNYFSNATFIEYDHKGRKIKKYKPNDPMSETTTYAYDENDSLISHKIDGWEMLETNEEHINTKCDIMDEFTFEKTDYNSVKQLIYQLFSDNKIPLAMEECEFYFQKLISSDKQTELRIIKMKAHRRLDLYERKVLFITSQQL